MISIALCGIGVFFDLVSLWARTTSDREEDRRRIHFAGIIFYGLAFWLNHALGSRGSDLLTLNIFFALAAFFAVCQMVIPWLMFRRKTA